MKFIFSSGHLEANIKNLLIKQNSLYSVLAECLLDIESGNLDDIDIETLRYKAEDIKAQYKSNQALLNSFYRTLKLIIILKELRDFSIPRNRVLTKILNAFSGSEAEGKSAIINLQFYYSLKNNLKCLKNIQFQNYQLL
jgi:hypothetical protein